MVNTTLGGDGDTSFFAIVMGVLVCLGGEGEGSVDRSGVLLGVAPPLPGVCWPGERLPRLRPPTGLLFCLFLDRGLLGTETAMGGSTSAATSCCWF